MLLALQETQLHEHLCPIYDTHEEQLATATAFIRVGLERGEQCVYVATENSTNTVFEAMQAAGVDMQAALDSKAMSISTEHQTYLRRGHFNADEMIELLTNMTRAAKDAGFSGLRYAAEMSWLLRGEVSSEQILKYESRLNDFLEENDACILCQYDHRRFEPDVILDAIRTHPVVIYDGLVCPNPYFIPPADLLRPDRAAADVDRFLNIIFDRERLNLQLIASASGLVAAYDATIKGWSKALDLRDRETEGHTERVTEMVLRLGRAAGLSAEELAHVRRGALLHDIGKLGIPDAILLKPGPLTEDEWAVMRKHPQYAYDWLSPIEYLHAALDIPYCHHEKFDGTGYPRGLSGTDIPLAARLFAVLDVYDALTSDRPYRPAWSQEEALTYIRGEVGKHFDPDAVDIFRSECAWLMDGHGGGCA
jgi:HD-GYP domain-containing protein (c-di-GMP phosphodiesterase class II)